MTLSFASFADRYEGILVGPLFRPWAEVLLDLVEAQPGDRVLDVACGTGIVARLARERVGPGIKVVGVDPSGPMLSVARTLAPGIEWREGKAEALPLLDGERFEVVVCQQGLQFFPDRPAAVREMCRALEPGGRLGVAVWRSLEDAPLFRDLHRVAERHLGPVVDQRHAFGDPGQLEALLEGAGFVSIRIATMSKRIRFDDGRAFVGLNAAALVGMSARGKSMSDEEKAAMAATIAADSAGAAESYRDGDGIAFELPANLATARTKAA